MSATRVHRPLFSKRFFSPALPNSPPSIADTLPPYDTMHRDRGGASQLAPYRVVPAQLPPPKPDHSFTRRPKSKLALFWWRKRLWIESTFALTVYEPWEKVVVCEFIYNCLVCSAIIDERSCGSSPSLNVFYVCCASCNLSLSVVRH